MCTKAVVSFSKSLSLFSMFLEGARLSASAIIKSFPGTWEIVYLNLITWRLDKKLKLRTDLLSYWPMRAEFAVYDGLLLKGTCLVIPAVLQRDILSRLHEAHQGIVKCRECARNNRITSGADSGGGRTRRAPPLKLEKIWFFWRKIVIFHKSNMMCPHN
jgi:hypothetical protein